MPPATRQLTILFADIADSTRLYEAAGDIEARELITGCLTLLIKRILENGGTVVKTIGDEVLCTFKTPDQAAETAMQMHEDLSCKPVMKDADMHLRIGFHHGEVICESGDVFGEAVNVAARMAGLAKADQIITDKKTLAMMNKTLRQRARIVDLTRVRGKDDLMEIHELIWGRPDQMTMTGALTEEVVAALTLKQAALQIRYRHHHLRIDHKNPILTLGRGRSNHLTVDDRLVSRIHARIEHRHGRVMLIDRSTNGTFLKSRNEVPVILRRDEMPLKNEGIIGLGQKVGDDHPLAIHYRIV